MLTFTLIRRILDIIAQFVVHTTAYGLSASYRVHAEPFGGYMGYIQTQLLPRATVSLTVGWHEDIIRSVIVGLILFIIIYLNQTRLMKIFMISVFFVIFVGATMGRSIIRQPIWGPLTILLWIICISIANFLFGRIVLSDKEDDAQ